MTKLGCSHKYKSGIKVVVDGNMFEESFGNKAKIDDILKLIEISDLKERKTIGINAKGHTNVIEIINAKTINTRVKMLNKGIDGVIITNLDKYKDKISLILPVADCAPITFSSNNGKNIGLIHAGWQGISKDIIGNLIKQLKTVHLESLNELEFYIGPMVGENFEFGKKDYFKYFFKFFDKGNSYGLNSHDYFNEISEERGYINLRKMIINMFIKNGINENQIKISNIETNSPNNDWHSHRNTKTKKRIGVSIEN